MPLVGALPRPHAFANRTPRYRCQVNSFFFIMRYIEFIDGSVVLGPGGHFSHVELLNQTTYHKKQVASAGFLAARYDKATRWKPYGESVGLDIKSSPRCQIPDSLTAARARGSVLFASSAQMLRNCKDEKEASWGLSKSGEFDDLPVFTPLHPDEPLATWAILCN